MLVSLNSELLESASISALGQAAFYGKGVFTTLRVVDRTPFLWDKHWRRLKENADLLSIDVSDFPEQRVVDSLCALLERSEIRSGRARITFFDASIPDLWGGGDGIEGTSMLVTSAELLTPPREFRISRSTYIINSRSPLAGIKSCNYLERVIAKREARDQGFDECIQLNERGEITSASMANVFWIKDGRLFTPSLTTGCLAGTTREHVLENFECEEVEADGSVLDSADEIFLTSAGLGVMQVVEFEGRRLECTRHPILDLLPPDP